MGNSTDNSGKTGAKQSRWRGTGLEDFFGLGKDFDAFQKGPRADFATMRGNQSMMQKIASDVKHGMYTYGHANAEQLVMKVTGVALGTALAAYGAYHAYEGANEEPRPELSHEGVHWRHIATGLFCLVLGAATAHIAHRSGHRDLRVLEDFNAALEKASGKGFIGAGV